MVYISGPMSGLIDENASAFSAGVAYVRDVFHADAVNPHALTPARLPGESDSSFYDRCLRLDLAALARCDVIFLLPGWQQSKGVRRELALALSLGLEIALAPLDVPALQPSLRLSEARHG